MASSFIANIILGRGGETSMAGGAAAYTAKSETLLRHRYSSTAHDSLGTRWHRDSLKMPRYDGSSSDWAVRRKSSAGCGYPCAWGSPTNHS